MTNIWESIKKGTTGGTTPNTSGATFKIQFGTESVQVELEPGLTLKSAMDKHCQFLGYDGSRALTWREGSSVVSESFSPTPNATYVASVSMETKG